jgi:hypothetical protein
MKLLIFLFLTISFSVNAIDPSLFKKKSFSVFVSEHRSIDCKGLDKVGDLSIDMRLIGIKSDVAYTGNTRDIPKHRKEYLKKVATGTQKPIGENVEKEIEIKDTFFKYWLPIQKKSYDSFIKVAKKGQRIKILLRKLGCLKEKDRDEVMTILIAVGT